MSGILTGIGIGLAIALAAYLAVRLRGGRAKGGSPTNVQVFSSIEEMRTIGELSVFKVITKEIVTADKHLFGPIGKKFLNWMVSSKKMAMIIMFDIDFRYDLQSPDFVIERKGQGLEAEYRLTMPKCLYETHITDLRIYDERASEFLPVLVPDILSKALGGGFTESDKNELITDAKRQASEQAKQLVVKMRSEVQNSARQTLSAIAQGFGARKVAFDFNAAELVPLTVKYEGEADARESQDAA